MIIGAGQAGGRVAESLRKHGFAGSIALIGDEHARPYERPSLSKEMLLDLEAEKITWLHDEAFYAAQSVELELGAPAATIDREKSRVVLRDGTTRDYGVLILATGARVRELEVPGAAERCFYLRSIEHSRALRSAITPQSRLVVIGAGFIGLEVAAAARARGAQVTVVETASCPLSRVAPPPLQDYVRSLHAAHGVEFRFDATVERIENCDGGHRVIMTGGEAIEGDIVVVGVGAVPNVELAAEAGLPCGRGILVDTTGATADPCIFAIGDVAEQEMPLLGRHVLLESWQNAQDGAIALGAFLARGDASAPEPALPWFWSDQYDRNIQIYGLVDAELSWIERGSRDEGPWILVGVRDGRIIYAAGVNAGRDLRALREIIKLGAAVDVATLSDPGNSLMSLLKTARLANAA